MNDLKMPFPYFGGKSQVADAVWLALGDAHRRSALDLSWLLRQVSVLP